MKFLLDMGLSPRTAGFLRSQGHDAVHLRDQNLSRLPDEQIITKAAQEQRVLVTFDLDFARLLALLRLAQPSVILFRIEHFTTDWLNQRLLELMKIHGPELEAGAIVV